MSFKCYQQETLTKRQRNKYSQKKITLGKATDECDKSDFMSKKSMLEEIFRA